MSLERICPDNYRCRNNCGSGPCSRSCQTCQRLAWSEGVPCPACPDFTLQAMPEIQVSKHMPEIQVSKHMPEGTILLAPVPPLCPQSSRHGPMELLIRNHATETDPLRQRFLEPPVYACSRCMTRLPGDWKKFGLITGIAVSQIPEAQPDQVTVFPTGILRSPQDALRMAAFQFDRRADPDPGSLRLELRAHAMVTTHSGPGTGETVTTRAMWSTGIGVNAQIVLCWTEHGGEYESVIAEAVPAGEGIKDITSLVSVAVKPARPADTSKDSAGG